MQVCRLSRHPTGVLSLKGNTLSTRSLACLLWLEAFGDELRDLNDIAGPSEQGQSIHLDLRGCHFAGGVNPYDALGGGGWICVCNGDDTSCDCGTPSTNCRAELDLRNPWDFSSLLYYYSQENLDLLSLHCFDGVVPPTTQLDARELLLQSRREKGLPTGQRCFAFVTSKEPATGRVAFPPGFVRTCIQMISQEVTVAKAVCCALAGTPGYHLSLDQLIDLTEALPSSLLPFLLPLIAESQCQQEMVASRLPEHLDVQKKRFRVSRHAHSICIRLQHKM